MAINFRSIVTDPKIEIVGDEVPLAAFEKASNILNQRYAQSAEAATRAQEALNQQLQVSDEREKEALKAYYDDTYGQLKNIATSDDYLDQEWKTKSLGLRTAANLKLAEDRAKIAAQQREQLRLAKNIDDPEIRKMYEDEYNKQFAQTKYDPNTGLINFGTLNAPRVVEDKSIPQELNKALAGFAANTIGTSWDNVKIVNKGEMIPGTNKPATATLAYDLKGKKIIENVTAPDLKRAADDFISSDPGIQSYLGRQVNFLKYKDPNLTDEQASQVVKKTIVDPGVAFAINKFDYEKNIAEANQDFNSGLTSAISDDKKRPIMGIPVNTLANSYGNIEGNLRENLVKGLTGQKGSLNAIMNFVNSKVANLPEDKQPKNYKEFKGVLDEVKNLTPEQQASLAPTFESVFKPGVTIAAASASLDLLKDPKLRSIQDKLLKNVGTYFSFDTEAENEFDNYVKENNAFQNINLLTPSYQDAESINKMQTWMDKSLAANDFKSFKGEIDPKASYALSKVSDRPVGNGTGIVIEFKNNKDNSTILVEPKDERMLYALESNFPGIVAANMFKNTSDFNAGEIRPVSEIFKENNKLMPKNYPDNLKNAKVFYKDGMFMLIDSKGNLLGDQNGQPITSTSYLDLIQ
jgi:hypothetical protein